MSVTTFSKLDFISFVKSLTFMVFAPKFAPNTNLTFKFFFQHQQTGQLTMELIDTDTEGHATDADDLGGKGHS